MGAEKKKKERKKREVKIFPFFLFFFQKVIDLSCLPFFQRAFADREV